MVMECKVGDIVALREFNQFNEWSSAMKNGFDAGKPYYVVEIDGKDIYLGEPEWPFGVCQVGDPEDIIPYEKD